MAWRHIDVMNAPPPPPPESASASPGQPWGGEFAPRIFWGEGICTGILQRGCRLRLPGALPRSDTRGLAGRPFKMSSVQQQL
ncbi:hypothetical protein FH972_026675 [Carpinus fangiana]|uniref:Uncharacterized protein n=1 Tax=Carpinus fangiana TaxID=176857 RepID=A0A5N6L4Z3_9ROSI|nr:hypothetical protein FH972_026675 [Carpinus fangiana]